MGPDEPGRVAELRDALFADDDLERHGITLFGASLNRTRGGIRVQIAAQDAECARAEIRRRYGNRVDVEVVATSAYLVEDVPWECWTDDGGKRVTIWLLDWTDGSDLSPSHRESDEEVVITPLAGGAPRRWLCRPKGRGAQPAARRSPGPRQSYRPRPSEPGVAELTAAAWRQTRSSRTVR